MFNVGLLKYGISKIPLDEFPIIPEESPIKEKYFCWPRDSKKYTFLFVFAAFLISLIIFVLSRSNPGAVKKKLVSLNFFVIFKRSLFDLSFYF